MPSGPTAGGAAVSAPDESVRGEGSSTSTAASVAAAAGPLRAMPRLSGSAWRRAHPLTRWLVATRAAVGVMTFSAAAFGGLLALRDAQLGGAAFDAAAWLLCCIGLLLAHATNNLLNDWTDTVRGVDDGNYFRTRYGTHVLEHGLLDARGLWGYIIATGIAALLVGLLILWRVGPLVLLPLLAGAFFLLFYTWPLKQLGLGEPAVLLVWGPLMVGGTHLVATGTFDAQVLWAGLLFGLGPTLVIFGKHIDKLELDAAKGVATLPVRIGEQRSRRWVRAMTFAQLPLLLALVITGLLPALTLIALLSLPSALRLVRMCAAPRPSQRPDEWPAELWPLWFVAAAFGHARQAGLLLIAGLLLETLRLALL